MITAGVSCELCIFKTRSMIQLDTDRNYSQLPFQIKGNTCCTKLMKLGDHNILLSK